jgi:hypothetical protein
MADKVKWKVNDGTQVRHGDKLHGPGDSFSATEDELRGAGLLGYVSKVQQQSAAPAENKAQSAPKARQADTASNDDK